MPASLIFCLLFQLQDQRRKPNMFPNQAPRMSLLAGLPPASPGGQPSIRTHWSPSLFSLYNFPSPLPASESLPNTSDGGWLSCYNRLSNKRLLFVLPGVVLVYFCSHLPKVHWLNGDRLCAFELCPLTTYVSLNVALLLMTQNTTHTLVSTHTTGISLNHSWIHLNWPMSSFQVCWRLPPKSSLVCINPMCGAIASTYMIPKAETKWR